MNVLDCKISFFNNCRDTGNPVNNGTFFQIVTSEKLLNKYGLIIDQIRATNDPEGRKRLKEKLPCFTPSGTFGKRNAAGLITRSGLMSFDLDAKENPFLNAETVEAVKAEISKLPEVVFCEISASGTGLWGVVLTAYPERHNEQFESLEKSFARMGYKIDPACRDVCRLRFWSYDPAPYFNLNARPFTGLHKRASEPLYTRSRGHLAWPPPDDLPAQAAAYLAQNRIPLECTYDNFMRIAFACKHEWGEAGKDTALDILHACTTFSTSNTVRNFDTLWRNIRRDTGTTTTAGSLVHLAKTHGFKYKATTTAPQPTQSPNVAHAAPQPPTATKPAPSALRRERFTDRETGQPFEVLLNGDGYPAAWDLPDEQRESLARMIQKNPAVTELIARFDLKPDGV